MVLIRIKAQSAQSDYAGRMSQPTLLAADGAQAVKLADVVQVSAAGIVSRTLLNTPEVRVVLFTFAEGQELTPHTNRRRALIHVVEGACDFLFEGKWQRLETGTFLHLPPNHPHAVRANAGAFSMLLVLAAEPTS